MGGGGEGGRLAALLPFSAWLFSPPLEAVGAWREEGEGEREAQWEGREREAEPERVGSPSPMGISHPLTRRP